MDEVFPANYAGHGMDFARAYVRAALPWTKPPTFHNRRPKWFENGDY